MTSGRALVVGASSGIGRAVAAAAADAGWLVAAVARRKDRLDDLVAEHAGVVAVPGDVRDGDACASLVDSALHALGGLDALVYAAGVVPLRGLAIADAAVWHDVLSTNLVGAALVTAAALPHIERAVYLSSDSVGTPLPGLVPYAASKAGLEELVRGWRAEHPEIHFTTLVVGPTLTGMADGWDPEELTKTFQRWADEGYAQGRPSPQPPETVAVAVVDLLEAADPPPTARAVPGEEPSGFLA